MEVDLICLDAQVAIEIDGIQLRSAYNLMKGYAKDNLPLVETESYSKFYPRPIGESAKFEVLLNDLFAKGRVTTDPLNKKEIIYYKDMEHPNEIYGKESILELPMAPCLEAIPTTFAFSKSVRDRLSVNTIRKIKKSC